MLTWLEEGDGYSYMFHGSHVLRKATPGSQDAVTACSKSGHLTLATGAGISDFSLFPSQLMAVPTWFSFYILSPLFTKSMLKG